MRKTTFARTEIEVSPIAYGVMTFGEQNNEKEACQLMDKALDLGITLFDNAEMYPVPAKKETQGASETLMGRWLSQRTGTRSNIQIATKITGPRRGFEWIRGGPKLNREHIHSALEDSLRRLQTDYVDLYQIHWPARETPIFGPKGFDPSKVKDRNSEANVDETILAFHDLIQAGKIRAWGLSNENAWGIKHFVERAKQLNLTGPVTVQNAYSLLNRSFDSDTFECCFREDIGLLAYSPLAFGHLTGKYLSDPSAHGRLNQFPGFGQRYAGINVQPAVRSYLNLAEQRGISLTQLALGFVMSHPQLSSMIIGATVVDQLEQNMLAATLKITADLREEIDAIHEKFPNPAP